MVLVMRRIITSIGKLHNDKFACVEGCTCEGTYDGTNRMLACFGLFSALSFGFLFGIFPSNE